jgi:hypothetical protein
MRRYVLPILGLYLDFIIVSTFVSLASYLFGQAWTVLAGSGPSWQIEYGVALALVLIGRALGLSAGKLLLSTAEQMQHEQPRPRLWPNLVLGTFLILDGLKQMLRWSQLDAVLPVFGMVETTALKAGLLVAMGALYVVAGGMILRFARGAKAATITALAVSAASLGLSWSVLPEAIARAQTARRAAQGMPIREGEIEMMQTMLPWIGVGGVVLVGVLVWMSWERERSD